MSLVELVCVLSIPNVAYSAKSSDSEDKPKNTQNCDVPTHLKDIVLTL